MKVVFLVLALSLAACNPAALTPGTTTTAGAISNAQITGLFAAENSLLSSVDKVTLTPAVAARLQPLVRSAHLAVQAADVERSQTAYAAALGALANLKTALGE